MRNGRFFTKEYTMTIKKVQYTAKIATMNDENRSFRSGMRSFVAISAVASAFGLGLLAAPSHAQTIPAAEDNAIRPFHINVPEAALVDLRQRIAATRWPDKETVNDESQGIRLAEMQTLVHYWGNGYNWRNVEAKLNALPEFVTTIDG